MTDTHWSLKIFSGAHLGAEIDLPLGSYTLGRHEDCDFVLTDSTLAEQHFEITINDSGVQLKSLCDQTFIIDNEDQGVTCNPSEHQLISINTLTFAFGHIGKPWPNLTPAENTSILPTKSKEGSAEEITQQTTVIQEQTQKRANAAEAELSNSATIPADNKNSWFRRPAFKNTKIAYWLKQAVIYYRWLVAGLVGVGCLVLLGVAFWWLWQETTPENSAHKPINYLETANAVKNNMVLPDVHIRRLVDGRILVSGYIIDNDVKDSLIAQLEKKDIPLSVQLIVMSDMRAAAINALKFGGYNGMHIELDNTPGSLVLSGYAPNAKYITKIRERLEAEVPGLLSVVEQVEYQSTREKALRTMLQEKSLNTQVKLLEQPGKITLKGRLNDIAQGYRFKEVVANFREKYGARPQLIVDVTIPATNIRTLRPELNIKSISLGRMPYVILDNGEKYLPGAKLENGYILESIGLDYLVLSLGQKRIKYSVRKDDD